MDIQVETQSVSLEDAIKSRIRELCRERCVTINGLAMLAGVNQSTINDLVKGESKNPKVLTILRICLGLDIKLRDFFDSPLFDNLDDEDKK